MNDTLDSVKKQIDLLNVIEVVTGERPKKYGNKYRFNKCPFCNHKGHFFYYPNTNSYSSFSGCCKGGTIVDWLIEYEGYTKEEAIEKSYSLAGINRGSLDAKKIIQLNQAKDAKLLQDQNEKKLISQVFNKLCMMYRLFNFLKKEADTNETDKLEMTYQFLLFNESFFDRYSNIFITGTYEKQKNISENISDIYNKEWDYFKQWIEVIA